METVKFNKDYHKLNNRHFTTIRWTTSLLEGEKVIIKSPFKKFTAKVTGIGKMQLYKVADSTLTYDTDTLTRDGALEELKKYYPRITWQTEVYVISFMRLEGE
jgi:hypothetical protein